jgi:hypothetical protein
METVLQANKECFVCGTTSNLESHHIFGGTANRKVSERYGLKVYLCHDRCHLNGVHKNAKLNRWLRSKVQQIAMKHYRWSVDEFRAIFGKNYSEDEQ